MGVKCFPGGKDGGISRFVPEESNAIEDIFADRDMCLCHPGKFFTLGGGEVRAVYNPVVIHAAVEKVLLSCRVGYHFTRHIFFAWDRVGSAFC